MKRPPQRRPRPRPRILPSERRELIARLRADAARIAARFGLRYRTIEAENARVRRRYGSCYSDGVIRIRLTHVTTGRPLKYSSMIDTLCHELAHLKHFHHGPRFRDFYEVILDWARREGIYRPGPRRVRGDSMRGGTLFDTVAGAAAGPVGLLSRLAAALAARHSPTAAAADDPGAGPAPGTPGQPGSGPRGELLLPRRLRKARAAQLDMFR